MANGQNETVRASLRAWAKDVGRGWYVLLGIAGAGLFLFSVVSRFRHHLELLGLIFLASLLVASLIAYRRQRVRQGSVSSHPRTLLRPLLMAKAERLEHLANVTPRMDWRYIKQVEGLEEDTSSLIRRSLGPSEADLFVAAVAEPAQSGIAGIKGDLAARADRVRSLIANLESLPVMGDWKGT